MQTLLANLHVEQLNDEVLVAVDPIAKIGGPEIQLLKERALRNPRQRIRVCAHKSTDDPLHEMLIVHTKDTYVRPHKHFKKSESFHVIEGIVDVIVFDETGKVVEVIEMGDYVSGRDFFKIHRQIDSPKPGYTGAQRFLPSKVKLQVESPKINTDSHLNKIKRDLVSALLNSELREAAVRRGFTCVKGRFADQAGENKSTTVFEVLVPDSRLNAHDEGNIALVHSALGNIVDELVKTFAPKLNRYFGEGN